MTDHPLKLHTIQRSEMDSEIFDTEWYRLDENTPFALAKDLASLAGRRFVLDARLPIGDTTTRDLLCSHNARVICEQVLFDRNLTKSPQSPAPATLHTVSISTGMTLTHSALDAHSTNFPFSRFARDNQLPAAGASRLYRRWWEQSLSGRMDVAHINEDALCTFECDGEGIKIDLVSVLPKRQQLGRSLLLAVMAEGIKRGASRIQVRTEVDNPAAQMYQSLGMTPVCRWQVVHLVKDYDHAQ